MDLKAWPLDGEKLADDDDFVPHLIIFIFLFGGITLCTSDKLNTLHDVFNG